MPPQGPLRSYEDDDLVIIDKPAESVCQVVYLSIMTALLRVLALYPNAKISPPLPRYGDIRHFNVSKHRDAEVAVSKMFRAPHAVKKNYIALVQGELKGEGDLISH